MQSIAQSPNACPWLALSLFDRLGVGGAVLQTALSSKLGTWNFERMFTPQHMSSVTCHMSYVTCHVSHVTYKKIVIIYIFFLYIYPLKQTNKNYYDKFIFLQKYKVVVLVGGGSVINGATPSSLSDIMAQVMISVSGVCHKIYLCISVSLQSILWLMSRTASRFVKFQ